MNSRLSVSLLVLLMLVAGCGESSYNLATGRHDRFLMTTAKEVAMGRKIAKAVEKELEPTEHVEYQERVDTIGAQLVAVCDRKELEYRFKVLKSDEVNAFSLPGGFVYLFDTLVEKTKNNDELAGVIAHEIAHVAARHAARRYRSQLGMQIIQLATIATQSEAAEGVGIVLSATELSYARDEEIEADKLAVSYLKKAGFDPTAMLGFLETMHALSSQKNNYLPRGMLRPQYGRTHPYLPERRIAIKEELFGVADYIDYLNVQD